MARPYPSGRGEYEVRVGMRSEDGECLCCFLRCPNQHADDLNRTHYPCDLELREYSFLRQVAGYEMDGDAPCGA